MVKPSVRRRQRAAVPEGARKAAQRAPRAKSKESNKANESKGTKTRKDAKTAPRSSSASEAFDGMPGNDRSRSPHAAEELSWFDFDRCVYTLARALTLRFKPQVIVGLAHGGLFVGRALASALKVEFHAVRLARRRRERGPGAVTGIGEDLPTGLEGRRVLVVDDVAASGDSLELALRLARAAGAAKVCTAALVCRPAGYEPDFCARRTANVIVFPWDYQDVVEEGLVDPDTAGA